MRVPLSWLAEYVDLASDITPEQVQADLVKVGFEEEDIHGGDISGPIVVGEVLEFTPEEQNNGKTIRWCQVRVAPDGQLAADGGDAIHGIVCGASNFFVGDKVVVTLPGAVLPGPFPIAARKTYGHVSDGMMASAKELGLGEGHDGIIRLSEMGLDPEVGTDALELLGLSEAAVEINVTPDRGYAFSIRGVAREYSHSTGAAFRDPATAVITSRGVTEVKKFGKEFPVSVDDTAPIRGRVGCNVFATRIVRGIDATAPTPSWMVSRLKLAGIRSISLPVDISNYVMIETGQPNHAYDLDKLSGDIVVRRAAPGEKIITLDEAERTLDVEDLLITSGGKPVGLAGVMGGANTEISDETTNVLIEAANFDPVSIARSARRHKLSSEASKRFERGVDPEIAAVAAGRVAQLLVEFAGGQIVDEGSYFNNFAAPVAIELPAGFVSNLIGLEYTDAQIESSLTEIGCEVVMAGSGFTVTPPTWRPDLTDKWTLAEEVARIVGYHLIPAQLPVAPPGRGYTVAQEVRRRVSNTLAATGHTEVLSYPFFDEETNNLFGSATQNSVPQVRLANALDATQGWMRTSLLPGLIGTAARNRSRGLTDLALFETGLVFLPEAGKIYGQDIVAGGVRPAPEVEAALYAGIPPQPRYISGLYVGDALTKQVGQKAVSYSWQDALTAVQQIALGAGVQITVRQGSHKAFHPGRTAELLLDGKVVGYAGELLPSIAEEAHLPRTVAAFELNLDAVSAAAGVPHTAVDVKTMPAATQDLSLVVDESVPAADVRAAVIEGAGELLESATLVDVYQGTGIPEGQRSLTFALRFRAVDRTLTAAEATESKEAGVALAASRFGATLRE
ncbi:phenylalanine--tRNA ligase subunit beta [Aurantimicrobium sp. MWH-Uga1]|uniref:phenylalanine--tRNA ligase subunit beta n=1 Tax=Aurantimicrobium sp. MWH-Uga1 TaxID=2079575 RepID=UPI000DED9855|nr:phenylalanine--tRNA ligase subunit beta [Aurantimicrobium sp. MWH-Uga1]AXE54352.1 Phenylalanine--tRNA ligase beta subunit [Aurantimicrobium sp. MWH-Uga1]